MTRSISIPAPVLLQDQSPLLIVDLSQDDDKENFIGLELVLKDVQGNVLQQLQPADRNSQRAGRFWRFDLNDIKHIVDVSASPVFRLELVGKKKDAQIAPFILPVMALTKEIQIHQVEGEGYSSQQMSHFYLSWKEAFRLRSRAIYLWSLFQPWVPPFVVAIPDQVDQENEFSLPGDTSVGVWYRAAIVVVDPWASPPPPAVPPPPGSPGTIDIELTGAEERLKILRREIGSSTARITTQIAYRMEASLICRALGDLPAAQRDLTWCCQNANMMSVRELLALEDVLSTGEAADLRTALGKSLMQPDLIERILQSLLDGVISPEEFQALLRLAPSACDWPIETCSKLVKVDDRAVRYQSLQQLLNRDVQKAVEAVLFLMEDMALSLDEAVEFLEVEKPLALEKLRMKAPENRQANLLMQALSRFNYYSGLPQVKPGTWVLTNAGWGRIDEILDPRTQYSIDAFMEGDGAYILGVQLHLNEDEIGEKIVIDMGKQEIYFPRAERVYSCNCCCQFISTNLKRFKKHHAQHGMIDMSPPDSCQQNSLKCAPIPFLAEIAIFEIIHHRNEVKSNMPAKKTLHPIQTTALIRESYLRYLRTAFPIQDDQFRAQFWDALSAPDLLVKGPLLEATPEFAKGCSLQELVHQGVLEPSFARLSSSAMPYERPLYLHQDQAIRKIAAGKRNVVVTTGTGSGKTEAFLIPILNHLLKEEREGTLRQPGVRALLLYPMNALANDQLKRLRRVLANFPSIKFGRYIGDTEQTYDKAVEKFHRQFHGEQLLRNELISREQMQKEPPHILLTNYSMLEYLLLRPADNAFFDGVNAQSWKFIALDEAHIYNGAIGIEIAMLLRRLKDRVVRSEPGRLQMIATSATLGRGEQDFPEVVAFTSHLFGERFEWDPEDTNRQDVVKATRVLRQPEAGRWHETDASVYLQLRDEVYSSDGEDGVKRLAEIAVQGGIPGRVVQAAITSAALISEAQPALQRFLHELLKDCRRLLDLQKLLLKGPGFTSDVYQEVFPGTDGAEEALVALVDLAVRARYEPESASLLPARYHVFARALEGAFVCLNGSHHAVNQPWLFVNRRESCPHCEARVWELRSCFRCGTMFLTGLIVSEGRKRQFLNSQPTSQNFLDTKFEKASFTLTDELVMPDEDELVGEGTEIDAEEQKKDPWTLCLHCGAIAQGRNASTGCDCQDGLYLAVNRVEVSDKNTLSNQYTISKCPACGGYRNVGIVRPFLTGQDAPVSVLATSLYQNLPPSEDEDMQWMPGQGRKLLVFSDSRQDAAFFAPYLERTYQQILRRRLILQTLLEDEDAREGRLRLKDLVRRLLQQAEGAGILYPNG